MMTKQTGDKYKSRRHPIHLPNIERHNQPTIIYLTVCTQCRKPVLASERMHQLLVDSWKKADAWCVGRYIVMPDHVHLFCSPAKSGEVALSRWVAYWKRLVGVQANEFSPLWQRDYWDRQLRRAEHYQQKWDYVVENPVRKGLVQCRSDWEWQGELTELRW